ncbi:hypothetical protein [Streptomyces sp. C36]|uniref:hypothetical protein n=1 Tax=Streptomyces sp. C36 TaxID=3237122 RepID=UPI0034C61AC8
MPIAFKTVTFEVNRAPMAGAYIKPQGFAVPGTVRRNEKGKPVLQVALQSFEMEVLVDGNPSHCSMALDQVKLELVPSTNEDDDGAVRLTLLRRNHPNDARNNPPWGFRGVVTALVIADIASS